MEEFPYRKSTLKHLLGDPAIVARVREVAEVVAALAADLALSETPQCEYELTVNLTVLTGWVMREMSPGLAAPTRFIPVETREIAGRVAGLAYSLHARGYWKHPVGAVFKQELTEFLEALAELLDWLATERAKLR